MTPSSVRILSFGPFMMPWNARLRRPHILSVIALLGIIGVRAAVQIVVPNTGTIEWTNPLAWSSGHVPGNGETPQISSGTVTLTGAVSADNLNFFGGSLTNITGGNA